MIHDISCRIIENRRIGRSSYFFTSISSREISTDAKAGHFVMLGLKDGQETFLRRPYSICGTSGTFIKRERNCFQLLYKVVGKGTLALSKIKNGEEISILGPLGTPFDIETADRKSNMEHLIVAGGIGSAPFPLLVHSLNSKTIKPKMFYGGRTSIDLPLKSWFRKHCSRLFISTEDGSDGEKGLITDLLAMYRTPESKDVIVYACGPIGMLRKVAEISEERGYTAYGSFEERMACGFGVCLGCAIPVHAENGNRSYNHVCADGPVFDMKKIDFDSI